MITNNEVKISVEKPSGRSERHRPQFHFSPYRNWMNDPNGLITFNGKHHMYYQYNPHGNQWGHMSWGHATSSDLVHWKEEKIAIPEKRHMIFSGTTALDGHNENLIAAFTSFEHKANEKGELVALAQHQSIAKSTDDGFSFQEIKENPVLDIGSIEFRDPKLFFDARTKKWNMLVSLATEHKIAFYQSDDLIHWNKTSEFGPLGNTDAVWECPDLFELATDEVKTSKWVLTVSAGHPEKGYLGMQYFVGDFDGMQFIADAQDYPLYLDYGKDFYAGITFANTGQKQFATMMAWLGSHHYSADTPTSPWRGAMSLPRDLYLSKVDGRWSLKSIPPHTYIDALYGRPWQREGLRLFNGTVEPPFKSKAISAKLHIKNAGAKTGGIKVLKSNTTETIIGVDFKNGQVYLDRRNSAATTFNAKFPSREVAPFDAEKGEVTLDIFVDHSIIEVFINDGESTMTSLVFPEEDGNRIKLFSENGEVIFEKVEIRTVKSIWK